MEWAGTRNSRAGSTNMFLRSAPFPVHDQEQKHISFLQYGHSIVTSFLPQTRGRNLNKHRNVFFPHFWRSSFVGAKKRTNLSPYSWARLFSMERISWWRLNQRFFPGDLLMRTRLSRGSGLLGMRQRDHSDIKRVTNNPDCIQPLPGWKYRHNETETRSHKMLAISKIRPRWVRIPRCVSPLLCDVRIY